MGGCREETKIPLLPTPFFSWCQNNSRYAVVVGVVFVFVLLVSFSCLERCTTSKCASLLSTVSCFVAFVDRGWRLSTTRTCKPCGSAPPLSSTPTRLRRQPRRASTSSARSLLLPTSRAPSRPCRYGTTFSFFVPFRFVPVRFATVCRIFNIDC